MMRGMVLGKFLPPHAGHVYLCEVARGWVDELTIVVGTLAAEPIPGEMRVRWMRELFPFDVVVHLTDENPQQPDDDPDFWNIWKVSLERVLPHRPDLVFASEPYGAKLAEILGARFVMVDPERANVPVSGTAIRTSPLEHWAAIPRCVRPHFVKRVSVFGPESTGKTTLARDLALALGTVWVPEWARGVLERGGGSLEGLDWDALVRGQIASEDALARNANRLLFCDTDPLVTVLWSEALGGSLSHDAVRVASERPYDLTLLLTPDVPWVGDGARYLPGQSARFFERCEAALQRAGRRYVVLAGDWATRKQRALDAVAGWTG